MPRVPKKGNSLCNSEGSGRRVDASGVHGLDVALLKLVEELDNVEEVEDNVEEPEDVDVEETADDKELMLLFC